MEQEEMTAYQEAISKAKDEKDLAEYIAEYIKPESDLVIPYSVDCYDFMNNDTYYVNKMEDGWSIIKGS